MKEKAQQICDLSKLHPNLKEIGKETFRKPCCIFYNVLEEMMNKRLCLLKLQQFSEVSNKFEALEGISHEQLLNIVRQRMIGQVGLKLNK